jgi:hypothetical protein
MKKILISLIISTAGLVCNSNAQKMYFSEKKVLKCEGVNNKMFDVSKVKIKVTPTDLTLNYNAAICPFTENFKKYDLNIGVDNYLSDTNFAVKDESGIWLIFKVLGNDNNSNNFKDVTYNYCIGSEENFYATMDKAIITKHEQNIKKILTEKYLAKLPNTEFTDQFGVSGLYYLSRPSNGDKIVTAVKFDFNVEASKLKVYFDESKPPVESDLYFNNAKDMKYFSFRGGDGNDNDVLNCAIYPIEKDLFLMKSSRVTWRVDYENCSEINFEDPNNTCYIIGKNKERIEQIASDKDLFQKLRNQALENFCIASNQETAYEYASKYPFPEPGMRDANVVAAATQGIKQHAVVAKWDEKIEYCYIKSSEWTVYTDKYTGQNLYRTLRLIAVMSDDKKCKWEEFSVKQVYNAGSWGKTTFNGNTRLIIPIDCTEAMKHKN